MSLPIQKIKRKECLERYPNFPTANYYHNKFFYPDNIESYILTLESKSVKGHINKLAKEILSFLKNSKIDSLIFLGDTPIEWLLQQNDYQPVIDAFNYLTENKIGKTFNGGLIISNQELPIFLKHLFWLTRCNSAFPYVHFMDEEQSFVGSVCKYGSLHLSAFNDDSNGSIKNFLKQSDLFELESNGCYEPFSKSGAIKGRKSIR